jgi:hypothetical protein
MEARRRRASERERGVSHTQTFLSSLVSILLVLSIDVSN